MTVGDIVSFLNSRAPFDTAEEWDNPGLLIGSAADPVTRVLVTLDVTPGALEAARAAGAELIVSHHPVIFAPLRQLERDSMAYRLAAAGVDVVSAHTNLDKAAGGVNDTLAECLGLTDVHPAEDGMCRIGTLPSPVDAAVFARQAGAVLGTAIRVSGGGEIRRVAVCGGSGGDFIEMLAGKADLFLTGEVKHHQWLAAEESGIAVAEAGHYATEQPVVGTLCRWLMEAFPVLSVIAYDDGAPYATV